MIICETLVVSHLYLSVVCHVLESNVDNAALDKYQVVRSLITFFGRPIPHRIEPLSRICFKSLWFVALLVSCSSLYYQS